MFCVCVRLRNSGIERDINYVKQRDREIDLNRERIFFVPVLERKREREFVWCVRAKEICS